MNTPNQWDGTNLLIAHHSVNFITFVAAVFFAWSAISRLRKTSKIYNARLLRFAYFSLISWILWALQYVTLCIAPSNSLPSSPVLNVGLGLGVMHNALWGSAVLSLFSERFSRKRWTVPLLVTLSIVISWLALKTTVLSSELITPIDGVVAAGIFLGFAMLLVHEWRLSKMAVAPFVIHGFSQWIWRALWFTPLADTPTLILIGFPLWRVALLFAWFRVISTTLRRAQPARQKVIQEIEKLELPHSTTTIKVMISSTVEDLEQERDAADRAIRGLGLTRYRAETIGSLPHTPREVCAALARQCDIFILIIGERYGYIIEEGISVVEFEFQIAQAKNPEKILVYVKDRVNREAPLKEFLRRLQDFDHGYFRSLFITPEELYEKIQPDIVRWVATYQKQNNQKEH